VFKKIKNKILDFILGKTTTNWEDVQMFNEDLYLSPSFRNYVDMHGNQVKRTPENCPYSYDAFVIGNWGYVQGTEGYCFAYSDRMSSWDYEAYQRAKKSVPYSSLYSRGPVNKELIAKFLSVYTGKKCTPVLVLHGCNVGNGYPYLYFVWTEE
jgi:hypothetical protein